LNLEEIILGCLKEDRRAQEALYRQFAPKMYGVCLAYVKDRDIAKDVLHDGFIKVYRSFQRFDPERSIEAWIRTILVNTALDHLRKQNRIQMVEIDDNVQESHSEERSTLDRVQMADLMGIIDKLPSGARTIFNLYTLEGYNHREIADKLNISEGTSKSQYSRAKILLRDMIAKYYDA
jgi:RNA polymerase sigma-70 factor (ECF subfamily)